MKYFNAFLSKGNPQVHGQILWFTLPKSLYILFLNQYTEKIINIYTESGFYVDFGCLTNMIKH